MNNVLFLFVVIGVGMKRFFLNLVVGSGIMGRRSFGSGVEVLEFWLFGFKIFIYFLVERSKVVRIF